ncbi:MAG: FAD:protein FMN transferase [Magnetococcales bacterium]|nr:FAD:protein FMN transferase [Magnetococcales bacterium]
MNRRGGLLLKMGLPLGLVALLGVAFLTGIFSKAPQVQTTTRMMMGTLVTLSLWNLPPEQAERVALHVFAEIARVEDKLSSHRPNTEVSHINQVPRGTWIPVSTELGQLLRRGLAVTQYSNGAFAMSLEPLTALWGFSSDRVVSQPPPATALRDWLQAYPPTNAIELQETEQHTLQIRLQSTSVGLDLGSIGKGYAIDRAIAVLRQDGVTDAVLNAGGDLRILGSKGGEPWRIGIQHPRQHDQVVAVSLLQGDIALATSGDYERFFLYEGKRYHHIMDPTTANPAYAGLISVSVQAAESTLADSLATAIFVLGPEKGLALLAHFPGCEALLITEEGKPIRTPGFVGEWLDKPF